MFRPDTRACAHRWAGSYRQIRGNPCFVQIRAQVHMVGQSGPIVALLSVLSGLALGLSSFICEGRNLVKWGPYGDQTFVPVSVLS